MMLTETALLKIVKKCAFKIANSWGTSFVSSGISSNTGYFWVMYDALNKVSANNVNDWEAKYSGTRSPAFNLLPDCENAFFTIDVAHKNVNFVGRLSVNTSDRETLTLKINRGTSTLWSHNNAYTIFRMLVQILADLLLTEISFLIMIIWLHLFQGTAMGIIGLHIYREQQWEMIMNLMYWII